MKQSLTERLEMLIEHEEKRLEDLLEKGIRMLKFKDYSELIRVNAKIELQKKHLEDLKYLLK